MTDINTFFDYENEKIRINYTVPGEKWVTDSSDPNYPPVTSDGYEAVVIGENGVPVGHVGTFEGVGDYRSNYVLQGEGDFGFSERGHGVANTNLTGGTGAITTSASVAHPLHVFGVVVGSSFLRQPSINVKIEYDSMMPFKKAAMENIPVLISDGESVPFLLATGVENNVISWEAKTDDRFDPEQIAKNSDFKGDLVEFIADGEQFTVLSSSGNTITVDGDLDQATDKYKDHTFYVKRRRDISKYNNLGSYNSDENFVVPFVLDESVEIGNRAQTIESITFISGSNDGGAAAPEDGPLPVLFPELSGTYFNGTPTTFLSAWMSGSESIKGYQWQIDVSNEWGAIPKVGDIIKYRANTSAHLMDKTAVIYKVDGPLSYPDDIFQGSGAGDSISSNTVDIYVYNPSFSVSGRADSAFPAIGLVGIDPTDAILFSCPDYEFQTYPKFNSEHTVAISTGEWDNRSIQVAADTAMSPSARFEYSANDYESAFGSLVPSTHFHIGPIILDNGQILDNNKLRLQASLFTSDPTVTDPEISWDIYGTRRVTGAEQYSGTYYTNGTFVATHEQVFNSSDMLRLDATISYGQAQLRTISSIPVHPSV